MGHVRSHRTCVHNNVHHTFWRNQMLSRTRNICLRFLLPMLFLVLSCTWVAAQTNTTGLSGSVVDPTGLKLAGATITLQHTDTGTMTTLQSNKVGEYEFTQIVPGHYKVTAEHEGFTQQQIDVDLLVATP